MSGSLLDPGDYFLDDLNPGDFWYTERLVLTGAMIDAFAELTGDRFAVHLDEAFARSLGFRGRIAHGLLGLALVDGLKNRAGVQLQAVASLGWSWDFAAPIHPGDEIGARIEVTAVRATKRPDRGIAELAFTVDDVAGRTVQKGSNRLLMQRRRQDG
jgi:acyl dehydratase